MPRRAQHSSVEINPGCVPDPANPHTWLVLTGDATGHDAVRVMFGCLRPCFRQRVNSATAFAVAKLTVGAPPDTPPWTVTAARAEVLLPIGADDRLSDPRVLMQTVDEDLPVTAKALLAYVTFTFPTDRLHEQYEPVRQFTRSMLVDRFGVAALLIQHAPHRNGSAATPHVHVLIPGPRQLTSLGFGAWVTQLVTDKAHALISTDFRAFYTSWRQG